MAEGCGAGVSVGWTVKVLVAVSGSGKVRVPVGCNVEVAGDGKVAVNVG